MAEPPARVVEIDPEWMDEWLAYGFIELYAYLQKHAAFAAWLERTQPKE